MDNWIVNYKVKFTGLRTGFPLMSFKTKKGRGSIGFMRQVGNVYTETITMPFHKNVEPTYELILSALRLTEPNYDIKSITWERIKTTNT